MIIITGFEGKGLFPFLFGFGSLHISTAWRQSSGKEYDVNTWNAIANSSANNRFGFAFGQAKETWVRL